MTKSFELPSHVNFTVARTGDESYSLAIGQMDNDSLLKGLLRGLKNICGDSIGAKELSHSERVKIVLDKVARFQSGEIGDGVATVSEKEKELRVLFEAWLVKRGAKRGDAAKVARNPIGVAKTFGAIVLQKGLDTEKAESLLKKWYAQAESIIAARDSIDDDDLTIEDESEEEETEEEEESEVA